MQAKLEYLGIKVYYIVTLGTDPCEDIESIDDMKNVNSVVEVFITLSNAVTQATDPDINVKKKGEIWHR